MPKQHTQATRALLLRTRVLQRVLGEARKAAGDQLEFDFDLEDAEADVVGTTMAAYSTAIEEAALAERNGAPLPQAALDRLAAMVAQVEAEGMALVTPANQTILAPIFETVRGLLSGMVGGNLNPLQTAARMQEFFTQVENGGGGLLPEGYNSPYQWARLARTEAKFAETAADRAEYESNGANGDAMDEAGAWPAVHPNCMCTCGVLEVGGVLYMVLEPAPTCCEYCADTATEVLDAIGA